MILNSSPFFRSIRIQQLFAPLKHEQVDSFGLLRLCRHKVSGSVFSIRCISKSAACMFGHTEHVHNERAFLSQVFTE
jgi:hypothetical protein